MEIEFHRRRRVVRWGEWMERVQSRLLEGMEEREGPEQSQQIWFAFLSTFSTTLALFLSPPKETLFLPLLPPLFVRRVYEWGEGGRIFQSLFLPSSFFKRLLLLLPPSSTSQPSFSATTNSKTRS